jgi:hypothetical protein
LCYLTLTAIDIISFVELYNSNFRNLLTKASTHRHYVTHSENSNIDDSDTLKASIAAFDSTNILNNNTTVSPSKLSTVSEKVDIDIHECSFIGMFLSGANPLIYGSKSSYSSVRSGNNIRHSVETADEAMQLFRRGERGRAVLKTPASSQSAPPPAENAYIASRLEGLVLL